MLGMGGGARDAALADLLTGQLDEMKGLAMKLGQIVSYLDVPLSEEVTERLAALQTGTLGRPLEQLRPVFEESLGDGPEALFESIETEPVAAASIGQVHRARYAGRDVAVKVQYPGIEATFAEDLSTVHRIAGLASLASAVDGKAIVTELANRLTEECDYEREADYQARFRRAFANDKDIHVPEVVCERSGAKVLTSEWATAQSFKSVCDGGTAAERRHVAEVLTRFSYRSLLVRGLIQADPHPGNFAFADGGRVVFFDFGCVRDLDDETVAALRALARAILDSDRSLARTAATALGVVGNAKRFDHDHFYEMMRHLHRPFLEADFSFEPAYVRAAMAYDGPTSPNARFLAMPPAYVWVARLQWGLWSVLAKLGARGDFRPVPRDLLEQPVQRV